MDKCYGIEYVDANGNKKLKYKTPLWYYDNDPQFKERMKMKAREYAKKVREMNPEYGKETTRLCHKKRYETDPEYRQKKIDYAKRRYHEKKAQKALEHGLIS